MSLDYQAAVAMIDAAAKGERTKVVEYLRSSAERGLAAGHLGQEASRVLLAAASAIEAGRHADAAALLFEQRPKDTAPAVRSPEASPTRSASQARSSLNKHLAHPFVSAVLEEWPTVKSWAEARGYSYKAVHGWYTAGAGKRSIPAAIAQAIAEEFPAVPATEETWTNGIQRLRAGEHRK